ncbi:hypothetical protein GDO81_014261 [Engystomops pustulosus]|uniref:Uncharacterized protein n=1 Tax=Engystomops pustulosus TaxID=76066 RepID=A0AAV7B9P0_ENGPU|nr:hypothetical protein GDO81_014261 [Engystomops pustulosus]
MGTSNPDDCLVPEENLLSPQKVLQGLKEQVQALQQTVLESATTLEGVFCTGPSPSKSKPVKRTSPTPEITIRKEFKINGKIGERGKRKTVLY